MPLGLLLTHPPSMFLKQSYNNTTQTLQDNWLNVTTAVALANTQRPPTRPPCQQQQQHHHTLSSVTHCSYIWQAKLYLPVDVRWLSIYYFFCFKRKVWNYVEIQRCPLFFFLFFFPFKHWPRYCIFSYSRNQVGYYILSWCNDDYDHLFTRCTRCPPACLCVHERSVDSNDRMVEEEEEDADDEDDIGSVCVIATMLNVFFFPFFVNERFMRNVCVCVRLLLNTYLLESGKWIDVNLTACIWEKGWCVCVCGCKHVWLCGYCDS